MDKKLKYIRTFYTIIFTIIVLYIVRNNFILPNHIFKYKIFLSMEQKIENLVLGILVFFVSSISYFVVDGLVVIHRAKLLRRIQFKQ